MYLAKEYTYGFEDVSLEPVAHSKIYSRKDVDTSYTLRNGITLQTPIIASPMADVCDDNVAYAISVAGGIGCIHRFQPIEEQAAMVHQVFQAHEDCLAAVGTTEDAIERAEACIEVGACGIIVDVAFLNERTLEICREIRKRWKDIYLISGNVATYDGFVMGAEAGLDAIRVGIGNGQACRTSRVTGVGVGLVTSLMECWEASEHYNVDVICDGGMDTGGSFCKALASGAHLALMGRAFAATWEGPGRAYGTPRGATAPLSEEQMLHFRKLDEPVYKEYRGSASMEAQMLYKARGEHITSEGVRSLVEVHGTVEDVLSKFNGALRSSMSYLGANDLNQYRDNAVFRLVADGVFNQQKARSLQNFEVTV